MDYLESKAILIAVEIQQEINKNTKDIEFLRRHLNRLTVENVKLERQKITLKENYKECKL